MILGESATAIFSKKKGRKMKVVKDVYSGWNDDGDLEEIKKCPCCGGIGALRGNGFIYPEVDHETGADVGMNIEVVDVRGREDDRWGAMSESADTPEEAISNWNRRMD